MDRTLETIGRLGLAYMQGSFYAAIAVGVFMIIQHILQQCQTWRDAAAVSSLLLILSAFSYQFGHSIFSFIWTHLDTIMAVWMAVGTAALVLVALGERLLTRRDVAGHCGLPMILGAFVFQFSGALAVSTTAASSTTTIPNSTLSSILAQLSGMRLTPLPPGATCGNMNPCHSAASHHSESLYTMLFFTMLVVVCAMIGPAALRRAGAGFPAAIVVVLTTLVAFVYHTSAQAVVTTLYSTTTVNVPPATVTAPACTKAVECPVVLGGLPTSAGSKVGASWLVIALLVFVFFTVAAAEGVRLVGSPLQATRPTQTPPTLHARSGGDSSQSPTVVVGTPIQHTRPTQAPPTVREKRTAMVTSTAREELQPIVKELPVVQPQTTEPSTDWAATAATVGLWTIVVGVAADMAMLA